MPCQPPIPFSDSQIRTIIALKLEGYEYRRIAEMFAATGFYCSFMTIRCRFRVLSDSAQPRHPIAYIFTKNVAFFLS